MRPIRCCTALAMVAALGACGGSPVSPAERQFGAEQHPQLLAEFGGAYPGEEAGYVAALGSRLAGAAGLADQCTFTLVNSDVVNAFAVPGCYIYITRGLLAIVNSEGQLASVLSHELGHIAAEHSERQERRSVWRSLAVMAVGALTGSQDLTRLAGAAANFFTLRYSRSHEYEADDLGLKYLEQAGYDPFAAADMLTALDRYQAFQARVRGVDEAQGIPEWALTHPLTDKRTARAREAAADAVGKPDTLPDREAAYLRHVDGLLYGDDPAQGFVLGRAFAHPVMRIAFEAPPGFTLTNSPQAILIEGPDGMRGEFAGGAMPPGGLEAYAEALLAKVVGDTPVDIAAAQRAVSHGVPAILLQGVVRTNQGPVRLSLAAYAGTPGEAYHFLMISDAGATPQAALGELFRSFRLLTPEDVAALRPRYIRVHTIRPGETLPALLGQMAADHPAEQFLMLNGRQRGDRLRPGDQVKLIAWAR